MDPDENDLYRSVPAVVNKGNRLVLPFHPVNGHDRFEDYGAKEDIPHDGPFLYGDQGGR